MEKSDRSYQINHLGRAIVREYQSTLADAREQDPTHSHLKIGVDFLHLADKSLDRADNLKLKTIKRYIAQALTSAYDDLRMKKLVQPLTPAEQETLDWVWSKLP